MALRHDDGVRVKSLIPIAAPRRGSGVGDGSCEVVRGIRNYSGEVPGNGGLSRARVGARPVLISCQLRQATQWSRSGLWKAAIHHTPQQHGSRRSIPSGAILARLAALKRERSLDAGWRPSAGGQERTLKKCAQSRHRGSTAECYIFSLPSTSCHGNLVHVEARTGRRNG